MKRLDLEEVKREIKKSSLTTRIYIGCDSERYTKKGKAWVSYATVVVIHKDGCKGCEIYGETVRERDYDFNASKPILRMMNEVYKVTDLYLALEDAIGDRAVQIHLDINPDARFGSNVAYQQAVGYVKGVCQIDPIVKPNAFAASSAADRFTSLELN